MKENDRINFGIVWIIIAVVFVLGILLGLTIGTPSKELKEPKQAKTQEGQVNHQIVETH